jgi:lipopolysaccharide export system protein LptA
LALQLNPIIVSGFVALVLQSGISAGRAASGPDVGAVAQVPVAIPLPSEKSPKIHPAYSKQPKQTDPIKPSAVEASPGSQEGKPRIITPTTGLVTIESDLQQADNITGIVTATGNVRIVYPDQRVVATARQAQYYSKEGRVVLSGDVDVIQSDGHAIKAERVTYDVNRERITAEPPAGGQVFTRYRMASPAPGSGGPTTVEGGPKP